MSGHFVYFVIDGSGDVTTHYTCKEPDTSPCRTVCITCEDDPYEGEGVCICESRARTPNLRHGEPCNYLEWLESAADECYGGDKMTLPAGGEMPIVISWEGDYFTWEFAADV